MNGVGARAFDLRAHPHQERGEVADLRFTRGVLDDGLALGVGRGHHEVLGARHRDGVEHDACTFELRGARADVAVVDRDRRAHRAQPQDMQIDGSGADRATARQRYVGMPEPAEQRAEHENRRAHRLDQLVRRKEFLDARSVDIHAAVVAMLGRDSHALQQLQRRGDVVQLRNVAQRHGTVGEQRGGENRQRRVLRSRDSNLAVERLSANDR